MIRNRFRKAYSGELFDTVECDETAREQLGNRMARMRLADIAAQAGVSPATVSKYLNGHHKEMSEVTRERIAAVIERTGYRPNSVARNLRLERSRTIGVILADIRNPYSSAMLEELSAQATASDYALTCAISGNDPAKETAALDRLLEAGVDGLIVNTCGGNDDRLRAIDRRVPVVLLDRDLAPQPDSEGKPSPALDLVTSNNTELVTGLVNKVAGTNHTACTRIHLLTENDPTSPVRRERALTFMRELSAHWLAGSTLALPSNPREAARMLAELADAYIPLGLIAINGLVFQQLVEAISLSGLLVPERLRIATFDEYSWNRVLFGGVTTAAQDTRAIAHAVLERLHARITDETKAPETSGGSTWRREIPGNIIPRASTRD